jgi:hypothetical protein
MGFLEDLANFLIKNISKTVRHFSAFVFFVMTVGVAVGAHVAVAKPDSVIYAIGAPLVLALLSYYSTTIAALFFVIFVLVMFLLI